MLAVSPHLSWFAHRGAVYLYHDVWGYIMQMSPDLRDFLLWFGEGREEMAAKQAFEEAFGVEQVEGFISVFRDHGCLLRPGSDGLEALRHAIPVRARWALFTIQDDGTVVIVAGRSPTSTPRLVTLDPWQSKLWLSIDGERTCEQLASAMAGPLRDELLIDDGDEDTALWEEAMARVLTCVATWTQSALQWTRVSRQPMSFFRGGMRRPAYLDSTMPYARLDGDVPPDPFERDGLFDLRAYHRREIDDADVQFDEVETTLSHLFRVPHPALGGQTYAQRFVAALLRQGLLGDETREVLEVGGGTGIFARGVLEAIRSERPGVFETLRYRVLDISPALQASQREQLSELGGVVELVTGDAEALDLPERSVDLLLSNEVIADLRTAVVRRCDLTGEAPGEGAGEEPSHAEALEILQRYEVPLQDAPERFHVNLGAMRMLEAVARVLRPGGAAVVTEFGDRFRYPIESTHLDHPEYAIHFGHMEHVARRLGLEAEVVDVMDLLGMDPDVLTLASTRTWYRNLCWLAASRGVRLPKIAWTPEMLAEALRGRLDVRRLHFLYWHPVGERVMGLVPREFKALVLRRPVRKPEESAGAR